MISDEFLDEILEKYDKARQKNWDEFFDKHFKEKDMKDNMEKETPTETRHYVLVNDENGETVKVEVNPDGTVSDTEYSDDPKGN